MIAREIALPNTKRKETGHKDERPTITPRRRFIRQHSSTTKALHLAPPRLAINCKATRSMDILPIHQSKSLLNTYSMVMANPNSEVKRCFRGKKVLSTISRTIETNDLLELKDSSVSIPTDDSMHKLFHQKSDSIYNGNMMYCNFISVTDSILSNRITEPL